MTLRQQLPAGDWHLATLLRLVGDLAQLMSDGQTPAMREQSPLRPTAHALLYLACRSLPAGIADSERDREVVRILRQWGVADEAISELGYYEVKP